MHIFARYQAVDLCMDGMVCMYMCVCVRVCLRMRCCRLWRKTQMIMSNLHVRSHHRDGGGGWRGLRRSDKCLCLFFLRRYPGSPLMGAQSRVPCPQCVFIELK